MKLTGFEIHFEPPQGVFTSGCPLSGTVFVRLSKPTKMRGIRINFEGKSKAFWDTRNGKHTTKYRGHETYLNHTLILFGGGPNTSETVMHPEGAHMYPFSFTLNPNLPSSFEGSRGYIRYTCKATIDRPWKFDQSSKRAFTVIRPLDLNYLRNASMPIIAEREETMQGCCCDAGKLGVSLHLNKSGYVPGEPIVYDITIHNNTDTTITSVTLTLRQIVKYTGFSDSLFSSGNPKYHTKTQDISLFGHAVNIGQNSTHSINRATLVPSLPPSHLEGCNIIDIDYIIILKIPCSWSSLKIERGIIIGTVPVQEVPIITQPQATGMDLPLPSAPPAPSAPPPYGEAPPSYEECVFGKVNVRDENDDEHTSGQMAWAPAYPFYDWSQHSSQTYGGFAPDVARPAPPDYNQI